jgi:very-short-patch-repair endonuclease
MSDNEMFYGASAEIFRTAEVLRKNMTPAEVELWEALKGNKLNGAKFRRQHPISQFIVDFYCHKYRLVIELDGSIHDLEDQKERDEGREAMLKDLGLTVIRFSNMKVKNNLNQVLRTITKYLHK